MFVILLKLKFHTRLSHYTFLQRSWVHRRERLEILLFDANEERGGETTDAPPIGRASIPLSSLSDGDSVVGGFDLRSINGDYAGKIHVSIRWRVPLKPGGNYNDRALNESQVRFLERRFAVGDDSGMVSTRRFLRYALPRAEVISAQNKLRAILAKAQQQGTSLRRAFPHFDRDGDQQISRSELRRGLDELGIDQASDDYMLQCIFETLDGDGNDVIDFREFRAFASPLSGLQQDLENRVRAHFRALHTTRPGFREEFQKYEYERSGTCSRKEFQHGSYRVRTRTCR